MKSIFKNRAFKVIIGVIAFLLLGAFIAAANGHGETAQSGIVGTIFTPCHYVASKISNGLDKAFGELKGDQAYKQEILDLKSQVGELQSQLVDYENLKIYQYDDKFKFSLDSILLAEFVELKQNTELIVDFCTGSGCIAWTLAIESGASVVGTDVSLEALAVARSQFETQGPQFIEDNVLEDMGPQWEALIGNVDLIVSNPPYIMESEKKLMRPNVLDYEPEIALFVPDDDPLRFYEAVASWAGQLLEPGGRAFLEINETLGEQTQALFSGHGFQNVLLIRDFAGKNRILSFTK